MTNDEISERFGYHKPAGESTRTHMQTRVMYSYIAGFLDESLPDGREKALAFTALQESSMWAHAAIAMQDPVVVE